MSEHDLRESLPCVHCGLCLDACPTYRVLGTEGDSPRGRIYIMEAITRGEVPLDAGAAAHLDSCLGCLACETACPSGVSFGERIEKFRPRLRPRTGLRGRWRDLTRDLYDDERMLRIGLKTARILDTLGLARLRRKVPGLGILPGRERSDAGSDTTPLRRSRVQQPGYPRLRAALVGRCGADVIAPAINRAAVEVLQRNNVEVVEVAGAGCCGALDLHGGDEDEARALIAANTRALALAIEKEKIDVIVTTAAGCGAAVRDYGRFTAAMDNELARLGAMVSERARDICELLVEIEFERPEIPAGAEKRIAYHDACHLLNGCGITDAPRAVVEAAMGVPPIDLGENSICCGSAGRYNLDHPAMADTLGGRKAELVKACGADTVAVGNVGCILQISKSLAQAGHKAQVKHPVELLADAYQRAHGNA
ncbi:MAG: glycolate oxidase iron-sulfur subunit [Hyphomicrobiaceae bacterium]|jgi:glycolate oxidase iron-sulfur subunit